MGLLDSIFGNKKADTTAVRSLLNKEKATADAEKADLEALKAKQKEEELAFKARKASMRGGGRRGLMYQQNTQGVNS